MIEYVKNVAKKARASSYKLVNLDTEDKNKALLKMADYLLKEKDYILAENKKDVERAINNKCKKSFIDRLTLDKGRLEEMSVSLREIAQLPDPVNRVIDGWKNKQGLSIQKVKVPIGVIFMIYEARPNVTSDSVGLMFKSSNAGILRGGGDALNSNKAIGEVLKKAIKDSGIDFETFFIIDKPEHEIVDLLLCENDYIDLVIPRGGEALIRSVVEKSRIPVIKHYKGICSIFVDEDVDFQQAVKICVNAKVQRPSVCNSAETILVHENIASAFLPLLKKSLDDYKVEIRGDEKTRKILKDVEVAQEEDWSTEYLDLIISIKVVSGIEEAIAHINAYGSHHTDSILTNDVSRSQKFVKEVDSACCFVNISTRFSDGYQFGLGAEIGISTDKLHARGPMGLEDLTTYKYVVFGEGQIRE
jgi:glutamate-5-semialdehyde dehydrogenase